MAAAPELRTFRWRRSRRSRPDPAPRTPHLPRSPRMSLSPSPTRRRWRRAGTAVVAALTVATLSATPAFAGPGDTFDPGSISDAILGNVPGASDTFDPTIPWLGDGRPVATP